MTRWIPEYRETESGTFITVTQPTDPAYQLLQDDFTSTPEVYREGCYICEDPEFAQMGLPLCKPCVVCEVGHVPADDIYCDDCDADQREERRNR